MERYELLHSELKTALEDLAILSGDIVGPIKGEVSWQDVAGTAEINLRSLADAIEAMRTSATHWRGSPLTGPVCFPSPSEYLDK